MTGPSAAAISGRCVISKVPPSSAWSPICGGCGSAVSTDEHRSAAHQLGNRLAYDRVLTQVCAMLDIEHELDTEVSGLERDIERFRLEAELERAGVVLTGRRYGQAA